MVWRKGDQENFGPGMLEIGQWMMAQGLLTWELIDKEGQGQDHVPPPTPRQPYDVHIPPVGHLIAPHRYPEVVPANVFPLTPYSENDPNPPPHYDDLFPPATPHSQTLTPTYIPASVHYHLFLPFPYTHLLPMTLSSPHQYLLTLLRPPLFLPTFLKSGIWMMSQTGTCSSSLPACPHTLFLIFIFHYPCSNPSLTYRKKGICSRLLQSYSCNDMV